MFGWGKGASSRSTAVSLPPPNSSTGLLPPPSAEQTFGGGGVTGTAASVGVLALRAAIAAIPDPEIPVITIEDLGILRGIEIDAGHAIVTITPTYSGCPAMDHIRAEIGRVAAEHGFTADVSLVYAPAWTTDWLSVDAKRRLAEFGIAPPGGLSDNGSPGGHRLPTVCEFGFARSQPVWLDGLQGAAGLQPLRRAIRSLQGPLVVSAPVFHSLRVGDVAPLTEASVAITFDVPSNLAETFRYLAGQHVTIRKEIDGEDVRRSYSICANANSGTLRVGVKQIPNGRFSTWATTELTSGDWLDVMAPVGEFTISPSRERSCHYAAIVGGSGITPVLSLISTVLETEPNSRFTLGGYPFRPERHLGASRRVHPPPSSLDRAGLAPGRFWAGGMEAAVGRSANMGLVVLLDRNRARGRGAGTDHLAADRSRIRDPAALPVCPPADRARGPAPYRRPRPDLGGDPVRVVPLAQQHIDSALAGMLSALVPLFAALFAALFLRRIPGRLQQLGIGVGFLGAVSIGLPAVQDSSASTLGVVMVASATLFYGLSINLAVPLQHRYGGAAIMVRALGVATVVTAPFGLWALADSRWEIASASAIAILGVLGTGIAFLTMTAFVGRAGPTRGGVAIYFLPIVSIVLGVAFLAETVSPVQILGTGLVLTGAWLTSRKEG